MTQQTIQATLTVGDWKRVRLALDDDINRRGITEDQVQNRRVARRIIGRHTAGNSNNDAPLTLPGSATTHAMLANVCLARNLPFGRMFAVAATDLREER